VSDIALLAEGLVRLGSRCVFGIPGEGPSLELLAELEKLGSAFYLAPHEAAGALMAGGFGRVTGIPGVALSIKGPGFSNMLSGIASNWLDRNPVLSFSESYGPRSESHRMHKRMAHAQMVRPVVKAYADNPSPELLTELWELCLAEEPGPVHVDFSTCMNRTSFDGSGAETNDDPFLPREISRLLRDAQRPAVIAGGLATRRSWRGKLASLQIPVFTTVAGKGAVDETLPHAAGVFTNSGGPFTPEFKLLPMADLIVGLGLRTSEIIDVKALPAPLILLDELKGQGDGLAAVAEAWVDQDAFSEALDLLEAKEWGLGEVMAAKTALAKTLSPERWLPAGVFRTVQEILPDAAFFLDTGNFCVIGEHVLTARHPLHVMGSAQGRSMGIALPTSVGAALAKRGTPVVVAAGDGGIRMYPESITLAVQEKLPLLVLLMSDGYFSSVRQSAVQKGFPENLVRLTLLSWRSVFEALGCPARRVESLNELADSLKTWKVNSGPLFLELRFDPEAYLAMTEGLR